MNMLLVQLFLTLQVISYNNQQNTEGLEYLTKEDYIKIQWRDLSRIQYEEKYSTELKQFAHYPIFHNSVKALDGKKVMISGYAIPLEETPEQTIIVLSAYPFSACFFCGGAGPESVMDVKPKGKMERLDMDKKVTVRGTLELNADDLFSLYYILHDAELVE